jgi:mono/diheme cytochrome c family protein
MKSYLLSTIFLFLLSACTVIGVEPQTPTTSPLSAPTPDPTLVASGETVYAQHCAECHGEKLEGEADWKSRNVDGSFRAPPHDDSGHTWHHSDRVLREAVLQGGTRLGNLGTSNMPAYAGVLSDDEVEAVLTYIKSTWPEDVRAIQWEQTVNDPGAVDEN